MLSSRINSVMASSALSTLYNWWCWMSIHIFYIKSFHLHLWMPKLLHFPLHLPNNHMCNPRGQSHAFLNRSFWFLPDFNLSCHISHPTPCFFKWNCFLIPDSVSLFLTYSSGDWPEPPYYPVFHDGEEGSALFILRTNSWNSTDNTSIMVFFLFCFRIIKSSLLSFWGIVVTEYTMLKKRKLIESGIIVNPIRINLGILEKTKHGEHSNISHHIHTKF